MWRLPGLKTADAKFSLSYATGDITSRFERLKYRLSSYGPTISRSSGVMDQLTNLNRVELKTVAGP